MKWTRNQVKQILREESAFTVEQAEMVMEDASAQKREATLRKIVAGHNAGKIDGQIVDAFTASAMVQIMDALNPDAKAKYLSLHIVKMADITWKLVKGVKR